MTVEIPPVDERGAFLGMGTKIDWLATDPPIYRAYQTIAGYVVADFAVLY